MLVFITAVTAQIFIPIAELAIVTGIPAKEAEAEIEIIQFSAQYNLKNVTNLFVLLTY